MAGTGPRRSRIWRYAALLALILVRDGAGAADLFETGPSGDSPGGPVPVAPRYFPREGEGAVGTGRPWRPLPRRLAGCVPRRAPVPSDAPDDPSYVGSAYGLSKPSYYGFRPPLGRDDPFGRPLLPYCP